MITLYKVRSLRVEILTAHASVSKYYSVIIKPISYDWLVAKDSTWMHLASIFYSWNCLTSFSQISRSVSACLPGDTNKLLSAPPEHAAARQSVPLSCDLSRSDWRNYSSTRRMSSSFTANPAWNYEWNVLHGVVSDSSWGSVTEYVSRFGAKYLRTNYTTIPTVPPRPHVMHK